MRLTKNNISELLFHPGYYAYLFWRRLNVRLLSRLNKKCPYLEFAYFILTWRCNLSCEMCPQRGKSGIFNDRALTSLKQEELDLNTWKSVVNKIKPYKPTIQLFGGEPLLYEGAIDLMTYVQSKGLKCHMVTNGTLLKSFADKIVDSGVDSIWVSLDGPEEIHNSIRNGSDIYRRIIDGIDALSVLKRERKVTDPKINILYTITDKNFLYLNKFLESVSELTLFKIVFSHLIFINREQYRHQNLFLKKHFDVVSQEWAGYILDTEHIHVEGLIDEINEVKRKHLNNVYFYPEMDDTLIRKYYANHSYSVNKKCYAPWLTAQFHPDGSLAICSDFKVGKITDTTFYNLWNNEIAQRFRYLLGKKKLPVCDRCCMIHRHSLFKE